jgi:hypothetical protein
VLDGSGGTAWPAVMAADGLVLPAWPSVGMMARRDPQSDLGSSHRTPGTALRRAGPADHLWVPDAAAVRIVRLGQDLAGRPTLAWMMPECVLYK